MNAVRDRCLGIDAEDSPVEKYYLEIRRESERQLFHWKNRVTRVESKLENQAKKIKKEKDQNVNRLKTQKDVLQSQIDSKRTQLDRQHSLLRHATAEYEKANSNYSDWREALGRPPYKTLYRSLLESVRYDLSVERGTITEKKVEAPSISSEVSLKERNEGFGAECLHGWPAYWAI